MWNQRPHLRLLPFVLLISIGSCATPDYLSWRMETHGFLGDYTRLASGGEGELPRVCRSTGFSTGPDTRILVQSPTVWRSDQAPLDDVSRSDLTQLAKKLEERVRAQVAKRFAIVHAPAKGALKIRLAFTEAANAWVVADTYTTASRGRTPRRFRHSVPLQPEAILFAAAARVEVEISDAATGKIELVGQSGPVVADLNESENPVEWDDVAKGFDRIAEELVRTLCRRAERTPTPSTEVEPVTREAK